MLIITTSNSRSRSLKAAFPGRCASAMGIGESEASSPKHDILRSARNERNAALPLALRRAKP